MIIEESLKEHIISKVKEAYPEITSEQIIVQFPSAVMDYGEKFRRDIIGIEKLTAIVIIATENRLDRRPFIKKMRRQQLNINNNAVFQRYLRCEYKDYVEAVAMKATVFYLEYSYEIRED